MKTFITLISMIVISSGMQAQSHKDPHSSCTSHHIFDLNIKAGSVWAQPLQGEAHELRENMYELELDYVHNHFACSILGNVFFPDHDAAGESASGYGCGFLIGRDWSNKRSDIQFKIGPTLVWSEFCSIVESNGYTADLHELTNYFAPGALIDLCYKYKASEHLSIGVDFPVSLNSYFYGKGFTFFLGYTLGES